MKKNGLPRCATCTKRVVWPKGWAAPSLWCAFHNAEFDKQIARVSTNTAGGSIIFERSASQAKAIQDAGGDLPRVRSG